MSDFSQISGQSTDGGAADGSKTDGGSTEGGPAGKDRQSMETRDPGIVREIGIEEFQPRGTMTLALIYLVIIVLMWIFMYFFEFAGNDPSIIG